MTAPLVIIGTGLAGYSVAREWRKLDTNTPLVMITNDSGDFYSKPLLSTAVTHEKSPDSLAMSSAVDMAKSLNAEILTNTSVEKIDLNNKTIQVGGKPMEYSKLVLATGSNPFHMKMLEKVNAMSVNALDHYREFRKKLKPEHHVAIIGAGLVGTEFAHDLSAKGYRISVIAMENTPLAKFIPESLGKKVQEKIEAMGVKYFLNTSLLDATQNGDQITLQLDNNETVECDLVLSAIGIHAETKLAVEAGLQVSQAINVDEYLQTSDGSVYALGDCISQNDEIRQYIAPILHQARALAKTLVGEATIVVYPIMPVVVKTPSLHVSFVSAKMTDKQEMQDDRVLYYKDGKLVGFVLIGDANKERHALVAQM